MAANVEPPIHVVVIGLEAIGRNLVHQLIKVGHFADEAKLHITIISANQTEIAAYRMLHAQYPHLETIVRQLRHCFGPFLTYFSALHRPTRVVCGVS